jgi:drug/metabolite transporter (DMT)-like permease
MRPKSIFSLFNGAWGSVVELLIASAFWGFGFVGARWVLEALNANEVTLVRFAVAAAIGLPFTLTHGARLVWRQNLKWSLVPAIFLLGTLIFQTWGLNYTTSTKSGFITTLYVVFVPLLEASLSKAKMPRLLWFCVAGALLGTALIVDFGFTDMNYGDFLTLICALLATAQIYWLGIVSPKVTQPFAFNIYQAFWATLLCIPLVDLRSLEVKLLGFSSWSPHVWIGLTSLALGSTLIAFFLQVRAQRRLPPTVSSLIFLLESPFALVFSVWLLSESFHGREAVGAVLIFVSAMAATLIESRQRDVRVVGA